MIETPGIRGRLEALAGPLSPGQLDRLAVIAFLHDIGKCNSGFQSRKEHPENKTGHVREVAPLFFSERVAGTFLATTEAEHFRNWTTDAESWVRLLWASISHHGRPAFDGNIAHTTDFAAHERLWDPVGNYSPPQAMTNLLGAAREAFPEAFSPGNPINVSIEFEHLFSGLVMLADWIGSHQGFFPFDRPDGTDWSRQQARHALVSIGFDIESARKNHPAAFREIFGFPPRPLQEELGRSDLPGLLIAESDTGSGKTEAALMHFFALFAAGEVDGLYFALPTRVAARELYHRVLKHASTVFGNDCPPVLLAVPGYVQLDGQPPKSLLPDSSALYHEASQLRSDRSWSAEGPKRFLAASIAVGTIDQVLLSAIQVPHAHLRAACLSRSLLVIDEVHASDVYMRHLARQVLSRHLRQGGRALLLSATLGAAARAQYLAPGIPNPDCLPLEESVSLPYPSISHASGVIPLADAAKKNKTVRLEPFYGSLASAVQRLRDAITAGQRVLVILNTVSRAIALGRLAEADPVLHEALFQCNGIRCVHHGRFARADRELMDQAVTDCMGKVSPAGPMLMIGTQTLEQSLDIDADWLLTDLCPIDVLLQRIGREHRHDRGQRPDPVATVILPDEGDLYTFIGRGGEVFNANAKRAGIGSVYEDVGVLQLTRDMVASGRVIELPRDNRALVEEATHPERLASLAGDAWQRHRQRIDGITLAQQGAGNVASIPRAHFGDFMFQEELSGELSTRLGLQDRMVSLDHVFLSSFGGLISSMSIPGHLADGIDIDHPATVVKDGDEHLLTTGTATFRYSRFGLERMEGSR